MDLVMINTFAGRYEFAGNASPGLQ